ncbi:MAG: hypothetical protein IPP71_09015 [Bacteroidetes bacterium]|nr:hypothetical protein [Bacteroidota bacterium]
MGCSSCSTKTGDTSPGCKNNGTCGTSGCNKLNVYNWLSDMELPEGQKPYNIVEVRFKGSRKEFYRNSEFLELKTGDMVAVEGNPGHDIGLISIAGELVRFQLKKKGVTEDSEEIKSLYRLARPSDIEKFDAVKALEVDTMYRARSIALKLNLRMKLSDVEFQGDGKKATFYYTADERVDFRELIKKLSDELKTRIEMRQIGMRQEASRLGGIGSCGRELCCSTWLTDFKIVSTSAARYQNLSLNPLKLAGQCGKLKCCLNYELDSYMDAIHDIPDANTRLETLKGYALHRKTDIFKRLMWFAYVEEATNVAINSDNWIAIPVDRVKEIIGLNKAGEKPADLNDYAEIDIVEKPLDYSDVVGQDSLTRMMDKKKRKRKRNNKPVPSGTSRPPQGDRKPNLPADRSGPPSRPSSPQRTPPPAKSQNADRPNQQVQKTDGPKPVVPPNSGQAGRPQRAPVNPPRPAPQSPQQVKPDVSQPPSPQIKPKADNPEQGGTEGNRPPGRVRQTPPRINPPQE